MSSITQQKCEKRYHYVKSIVRDGEIENIYIDNILWKWIESISSISIKAVCKKETGINLEIPKDQDKCGLGRKLINLFLVIKHYSDNICDQCYCQV